MSRKCDICEKDFSSRQNLWKHRKKHDQLRCSSSAADGIEDDNLDSHKMRQSADIDRCAWKRYVRSFTGDDHEERVDDHDNMEDSEEKQHNKCQIAKFRTCNRASFPSIQRFSETNHQPPACPSDN